MGERFNEEEARFTGKPAIEKIYCGDCRFGNMKMKVLSGNSIDDVNFKWCQQWFCHHPELQRVLENEVNRPFTRPKKCIELNKNNDCKYFVKKGFWQKFFC